MTMTTTDTTPRVWIACLASYNAGILHGRWVDVTDDPADLYDAIKTTLESSPIPGAEEWAFHDYEGFGSYKVSEYESVESLCAVAGGIEEHGEAFAAFLDIRGISGADEIKEAAEDGFSDAYRGTWESMRDYAEEFVSEVGVGGVAAGKQYEIRGSYGSSEPVDVIEALSSYLDWDKIARDVEMDHTAVETPDHRVWVFSDY